MSSGPPRVPPILLPFLRAYVLGYVSFVSPRLLRLLLSQSRTLRLKTSDTLLKVGETLKTATEVHRLPTVCGVTVGGWRLLEPVIERMLQNTTGRFTEPSTQRKQATFLASLISGVIGIRLLNSKSREPKAGKTLDLTLCVVVRALDVIVGQLWERRRRQCGSLDRFGASIGHLTDAATFSLSAASVMFAWFYTPDQLPKSYKRWITEIADIDARLLSFLRRIRGGQVVYGEDTGFAHLLGSYCKDLGLPEVLGDPAHTVPIPCKLIHNGWTSSCELHMAWRFVKSWKFAFSMYFPLNLLVKLRKPSIRNLARAFRDSARSSAFLGTFVATFYYAVCLARTRLGPKLLPKVSPLHWDNQLIVKIGCLLCGWSILIENPKRRAEINFFVAPKALAVFLPREYSKKHQWRETIAFALSFAVIMTALKENPSRVRGVFGKLLQRVTD